MSLFSDIAEMLREVTGLVKAARAPRPAPPWRWGHAFLPEPEADNQCVYCHAFIPGKVKHTRTPCPGPDHKPTQEELGRIPARMKK